MTVYDYRADPLAAGS